MRVTVLRGVFISSFGTFCVNVAGGPAGGWLLIYLAQPVGGPRLPPWAGCNPVLYERGIPGTLVVCPCSSGNLLYIVNESPSIA